MTAEEKILILGSLFHDIGKFEQRCTGNPGKKSHQDLGVELLSSGRFIDRVSKIVYGKENFNGLLNIISEHHNQQASGLTHIVREADRLSASERVDKEEVETYQDQWKHKHLASLFSKIRLLSNTKLPLLYYKHVTLTKDDYDVIIPEILTDEQITDGEYSYSEHHFNKFNDDLEAVLDFYKEDTDFDSLINMLLILFEKYLWCIPDFTGNPETDISLYNHLKDVAGLSHAIFLTQKENTNSTNLTLIIGDIPGIQDYIFDVVNRKPAKILRGRSIFVQVLTRNFASLFLNELKLTDANLIMHAGGKFYIVAPDTQESKAGIEQAKQKIEDYLYENFLMNLSFNCAYETFDYTDLKNRKKTFGQLVEEVSFKLLENKHQLFQQRLFKSTGSSFALNEKYIDDDGTDSNSIKCKVTDKPIREGRKGEIRILSDGEEEVLTVDRQVELEYRVGTEITKSNTVILMDEKNSLNISEIIELRDVNVESLLEQRKILLNPKIDTLLSPENKAKDIFRNAVYLEVANFCSKNTNNEVMDFNTMSSEINEGAKYLSLIKGDIDNLGLIMAFGLGRDKEKVKDEDEERDLSAISRTTTLSNHLKYFFSFFLNGFLEDWEKQHKENKVYTIFAGGDDLMLITTQSSAVKLINALNNKFMEFTCINPEVHVSYSITHFKDHTPIRIVADFAEKHQQEGKQHTKELQKKLLNTEKEKAFLAEHDKAGTFLFETFVKNENLEYFLKQVNELTQKAKDEKSGLSRGLIRRLLELSEMLKKYSETNDAAYLIAYARLNYSVNRLLKDKEIRSFFDNVLTIHKEGNEEAQKLEKILHPLVCQVIYNIEIRKEIKHEPYKHFFFF
jgi:CRISPR-associated protein Csm1